MVGFIFDANKGETPASLARQRLVAEALVASATDNVPKNAGEGLAAIGRALSGRWALQDVMKREAAGRSHAADITGALTNAGTFPAAPSASGADTVSASSVAPVDYGGDQLAWSDAAPYQKALLNTISGPESGGRYNVVYGGGTFDDFSHHPNQAVRIQTGPNAGRTSSAAGKYQFLGSTWDQQAKELGLPDFSPANQDKAAWNLAAQTYKAKTGQDIDSVLQSGDPNAIAQVGKVLSPIWTSLPGGIEQGTNTDRFVATYQRALGAGASPAQATAAAQQEQAPVQVASLDPSAGVGAAPARPLPAAYASNGTTQSQWDAMNRPGEDLAPVPSDTPAQQPGVDVGAPGAVTPAGQRVLGTMMDKAPLGGQGAVVQALSAINQPPQAPAAPSPVVEALAGAQQPQPAAPVSPGVQQVAQAMQPPQPAPQAQPDNLPVMAGGSADAIAPGQAGPSLQQLMQAAADPWVDPQQKAVINMMLEQKMQDADPLRQLQIQAARKSLAVPPKQWQKLDDHTLYDPASGETKSVSVGGGPPTFEGTGLDAQAWNILQRADPTSKEYATAYAIISQPKTQLVQTPDGLVPVQVPPTLPAWLQAPPGGGVPAAQVAPGSSPTPATPAPTAVTPSASTSPAAPTSGAVIPGTMKPTETQRNRVSSVNQAFDAINGELDRYAKLVDDNGIEMLPGKSKDNLNTVRQGIMLQMKELFNLGVLNGPDLQLMENMIYDPVIDPSKDGGVMNIPSQLYSAVAGDAPDRAANSVKELKRMLEGIKSSVDKTTAEPSAPGPAPAAKDMDGWTDVGNGVRIRMKP